MTAPPFHPWCRTTTEPYFEDNGVGGRVAREELIIICCLGHEHQVYKIDLKKTYIVVEKEYVGRFMV